jgi:SnoaL-like domain
MATPNGSAIGRAEPGGSARTVLRYQSHWTGQEANVSVAPSTIVLMESSYAGIARLVFGYAERLDRGDLMGMAKLFSQATLRTSTPDGITSFSGADEVFTAYDSSVIRYEDGTPATKHVTTNLIVECEEGSETARARSYFTVLQGRPTLPLQPIVAGRYEDEFVRGDDTRWRFADRLITIEFTGNVEHHLVARRPEGSVDPPRHVGRT